MTASPPAPAPGDPRQRLTAGVVGLTGRITVRLDAEQQRRPITALPVAVWRKFSDDQAGRLAGQIAYAAFLSIFPLLLVLLASLGLVLSGRTQLQNRIVHSGVSQFPVVGADLTKNVHQLASGSFVGLVIGLVWLLYGALRLSRSAQMMMAVVWGIDRGELPGLLGWLPRGAGFLLVLGTGFLAGGTLAGVGSFGALGFLSFWVGLASSLVVNVVMYRLAFAVVVKLPGGDRQLWPGALFGGVAWTVLQSAGTLLAQHQLKHLSSLYGFFGTVLGLMWWMSLGAMVSVYAAEFNVVVTRRLWPRSFRREAAAPASPPGVVTPPGVVSPPRVVSPPGVEDVSRPEQG